MNINTVRSHTHTHRANCLTAIVWDSLSLCLCVALRPIGPLLYAYRQQTYFHYCASITTMLHWKSYITRVRALVCVRALHILRIHWAREKERPILRERHCERDFPFQFHPPLFHIHAYTHTYIVVDVLPCYSAVCLTASLPVLFCLPDRPFACISHIRVSVCRCELVSGYAVCSSAHIIFSVCICQTVRVSERRQVISSSVLLFLFFFFCWL